LNFIYLINKKIAISTVDSKIFFYHSITGQKLFAISNLKDRIDAISFSDAGTRLAGFSKLSQMLSIWKLPSNFFKSQEKNILPAIESKLANRKNDNYWN